MKFSPFSANVPGKLRNVSNAMSINCVLATDIVNVIQIILISTFQYVVKQSFINVKYCNKRQEIFHIETNFKTFLNWNYCLVMDLVKNQNYIKGRGSLQRRLFNRELTFTLGSEQYLSGCSSGGSIFGCRKKVTNRSKNSWPRHYSGPKKLMPVAKLSRKGYNPV